MVKPDVHLQVIRDRFKEAASPTMSTMPRKPKQYQAIGNSGDTE
jgi:hypothetical protein